VGPRTEGRKPPIGLLATLAVILALLAGTASVTLADRWPADLWESLDRQRF
jgi:hypothetical protein